MNNNSNHFISDSCNFTLTQINFLLVAICALALCVMVLMGKSGVVLIIVI